MAFDNIPVEDLLQQLKDSPSNIIVTPEESLSLVPAVSSEPVKEEDLGKYR